MAGWTEESRRDGRRYATRILKELIEVREGGDPIGARLLIDDAATFESIGSIAQASAIAESLLHRLAVLTGETEEQVLTAVLAEIDAANKAKEPEVTRGTSRLTRRVRRAGRSA